MSASDGYISGGAVKIVDHGANSQRWNLVILGDGYLAADLPQYHTDVQNFISIIRTTQPFDTLWCGINVHRIDVVSNDSGADDPVACGGTGATPATFFDATFCTNGVQRLLTVASTRARNAALAAVPEMHATLVIVNSTIYGGAGGSIATCSVDPQAAQIAIHELGHSAFGLADEYSDAGGTAPAGEPAQPNVTRDTNRATNKWNGIILGGTPMPSSCNAGCAGCVPPGAPVGAGVVGTFEGAMYNVCGIFRPQTDCKMRTLAANFCAVCTQRIVATLTPFLPAESINLTTPSIAFTDVPEGIGGVGITTYRAAVWEVVSCRPLTFRITAGPTGGFGLTALGTVVTVNPTGILPIEYARLWISYTSTTSGSSPSGSMTVSNDETGQSWVIPIVANTVDRPKTAVAMVLDRSGSMSGDAGDGTTKVQKLREAANAFVDVMLPGDALSLVRFDHEVNRLMPVTDVGAVVGGAGRATAHGHINGTDLDPRGATSIGGGVLEGKTSLDDAQATAVPPYAVTAMVVLTDGVENTAPMLSSVSGSITSNTFAVGLGIPANISVPALTTLTQGHNGYLLISGPLTQDQTFRLTKYFLQILAGITNANVVLDPHGELTIGAVHRIPFMLTEADYGADVLLLSQIPSLIDFRLEAPDGTIITPAVASGPNAHFYPRERLSFYRLALPALPADARGTHGGQWHALLGIGQPGYTPGRLFSTHYVAVNASAYGKLGRGVLPYELLVHAYSNLVFRATVAQTGYDVGAQVTVRATLRQYDVPLDRRSSVWCEITRPDGTLMTISLVEVDAGDFVGSFTASAAGVYAIRARARGDTFEGSTFTREQVLTAVVNAGGFTGGVKPESNPLCELLNCLIGDKGISDRLQAHLKEWGIDPAQFERCLCLCGDPVAAAEHIGGYDCRPPRRDIGSILQRDPALASQLLEGLSKLLRSQ